MNDYEIGYKKPPKSGQFRKGQSGNPSGRPKGRAKKLSEGDIIEELLQEKAKAGGQKRTFHQLMWRAQMMKAIKGDTRAFREINNQLAKHDASHVEGTGVLVVPGTAGLLEWSAAAAMQQEKYRSKEHQDGAVISDFLIEED